ncbi:tRNA (N6-isopentenyl adenosine(37)-C2)-methylthiotransferase MiaB [Simkania negevensis]|uniref:tRNA-2-methylthio-N(6)-dimethylallyladenosine synthase n=1 Tax=Simkania negevensis TaxID=83561 RepID=A0ABS3AQ52_9BACT|nr:tRNA (N6-isopentenyl adenosine(37)-C2)-methylthiotransferase MiaB [Simkania negevensis]
MVVVRKPRREMKKFFVRTYGCQMNELDTEVMVGLLERRGLIRTEEEKGADLLIYNTCSIRDLAERKVMGKLGKLGKTTQRDAIIGVTGCMANAKKETLFRKLPHVDFVLGTNNIHNLNDLLDEVLETGKQCHLTDAQFHTEIDYEAARRDDPVKAYVSIIRGCDKFCTYCVVPYTRGQEVSRHPDSIVEECKKLAGKGYREVTLLGQNVNSYGKDKQEWGCLFHDLLARIDKVEGIDRIRFMTSHPVDITRELMEAVRDLPSLCEFVHFPFQAGSNRILRKMHRIYTIEQYLEKVEMLRSIVPDVALGTDLIVGFPTETEEEFAETCHILRKVQFSVGFLFAYSQRKGTPAMRWKDDISEEVKQQRLQTVLDIQKEITAKHLVEMLGKEVEVLVERVNEREPGFVKGRTRCWKNVLFSGKPEMVGTMQQVNLHSYTNQTLLGDRFDIEAP